MEQKEMPLEDLFEAFQSVFNQAGPEEKKRLAGKVHTWAQKAVDSSPVLSSNVDAAILPEDVKVESPHPQPEASRLNSRRKTILRDMQVLDGKEFYLKQIAGAIEQVFWLIDSRSDAILYVSPTFETVWGRTCQDLYADALILIESVHPEDRVQVMVASSHTDGKPFDQAYRILRPDGSLRWIFSRTFLIHDEAGKSNYLFCIAQDITEQKKVELALRKTLDRTREQFNLSHRMSLARKPELVLKTLMSAHELRSAQRATLLFFDSPKVGLARGVELIAAWQPALNFSTWASETNLYEEPAFLELFQAGRTVVITGIQTDPRLAPSVRCYLLEGQIQTLAIFPLVASGDWLGCLLVYYTQDHVFDHVELRHLRILVDQATITLYNLKLLKVEEESRHEAERANEIKTEFLAMISHELRTPLTSIIGFTTTLLAEDVAWEPDEQHDFIQTIQQEANRLHELIDHLLDLSRLEAGMLPIFPKAHTIHEIVEDALPQLHSLTREQTLSIQLPPNLPPVLGDVKRIAQVLVNLVRNASTYSPKGTEISITASIRKGFVQINVSDQGRGIQPTEYKKVFKAFERGGNVENSTAQGAGLGLAICKGLVEAHGGRIWVKEKAAPGATLCFTLPLAPGNALPDPLPEEE